MIDPHPLQCDFARIGFARWRCKRWSCGRVLKSHVDFPPEQVHADCKAKGWPRVVFRLLTLVLIGDAIHAVARATRIERLLNWLAHRPAESGCNKCKDRQWWMNLWHLKKAQRIYWRLEQLPKPPWLVEHLAQRFIVLPMRRVLIRLSQST